VTGLAPTLGVYITAALAEIGGCFAFWSWVRTGASLWWLAPGIASLCLFAWLLTLSEPAAAGRAFAAYGGIYVLAAIVWMVMVERISATRADVAGVLLCVTGCVVILAGRR
jgi:small multidrug resistance family-3 protein